jgi:hypothetical protein
MIRQLIPDAYVGLFIHTPFPSSEVFRCLPSEYYLLSICFHVVRARSRRGAAGPLMTRAQYNFTDVSLAFSPRTPQCSPHVMTVPSRHHFRHRHCLSLPSLCRTKGAFGRHSRC